MKSKVKILIIFLALIISSVIFAKHISAQGPQVSLQVFYDQLSPYGQWIDYPEYGYVWLPDAGADFVPYSTRGHWIYTEYGWTWLSDYAWGWAPFHYGRWNYDDNYGWFWIPDTEWAPAWVSWRRANGYYGWEPMEPGISLSVSFGRGYDNRRDHWIFVQDRDIDRPDINNFYVNRTDHDRIVRNSIVINNTYVDKTRNVTYVSGPDRADIQKVTGRRVTPVPVQEYNKPGQDMSNGQLHIYRPQVMKNNDRGQKPVPSRVINLKDVKQSPVRNATNQQKTGTKPEQPVNANPSQPRRPVTQPNSVKQQNTDAKPVQPVNANPAQTRRPVTQPNFVKHQTSNPPQQTKKVEQPKTPNQQNANPPQQTKKVEQPNTVKQQNANPPQQTNKAVQPRAVKKQIKKPGQQPKKTEQPDVNKPARENGSELPGKSNSADEKKKVE